VTGAAVPRPTTKFPVHVADLRRRLGERRTVDIDIVLPRLKVVASQSVAERPVVGSVVVESIERGVSVFGSVTFGWVSDCRRCLEPVAGAADVVIDEIYQVGAAGDIDLIELEGDQIDLVPIVRDAVLVGLPLAPLCRAGCVGPDPDRYPAKTADDIEVERLEAPPQSDPRWAALDQLRLNEPGFDD
jgi:uncharacterized protein